MKATILHPKRAFLFVLFTLLLSATGMTKAFAQVFTVGNLNYSINDAMSVTVIGHVDGSNAIGELVIPENVNYEGNTYIVTAIGNYSFSEHYGLVGSLVIPNSVTEIGYAAFSGCSGFNGTLTLGNSLTTIGSHAFEGCSGFTGNLVIPNSVSILGGEYVSWGWDWRESYAFYGCSGFNGTLTLSNSLSAIGCGCFMGCSGFTGDLVIPTSVSQIGYSWGNCDDGAFKDCSGFTGDLTILGETEIGPNSFSGCSGFSGLTLGAFIIGIYDYAFFGCTGLTSITALGSGGWLEGDAESVFAGVNVDIPVYVSCDYLDDFLYNSVWSNFSNLQEIYPCLWEILATANPPESGTVSGSGLYVYEEGSNGEYFLNVDLCATPKEGYTFYHWTNDFMLNEWDSLSLCNNGSISSDYTYHRHYVAHFRPIINEITAVANISGGGTISGGGVYEFGEECSLTATANEGYLFVDWTENGRHVSYDTNYSFIVTESRNLVANFREGYGCPIIFDFYDEYGDGWNGNKLVVTDDLGYIYKLTLDEGFSGTQVLMLSTGSHITLTWIKDFWAFECSFTVSYSDGEVICQASEPNNSFFFEFDVDCGEMPVPSLAITAIANPDEGGTVSGGSVYDYGTECTLTATANEGYTFVEWTENGEQVSTDAEYSFIVRRARNLVANFSEGPVSVTQTSNFSEGYNWWSTYIEQNGINGLGMLQESLGDNGIGIRSQASGYTDNYEGYGWYGSLTSINNESYYRVITNASCSATMTGSAAVPSQHPITVNQGWTWIGYVPSTSMSVDAALINVDAVLGDKLKSQRGYSDYYPGYGWYGSLNTIEPGMGLMYYSENSTPVTFTYPDSSRGGELKRNLTAENNHWKPNTYAYPDNMTVMAVVELNDEELNSEHYELAAFANDECRGSVKMIYAEPLHRYVAFLTISGKDAAELSFRLYDIETGAEYYDAKESLDFVANAIVGEANDLYEIHFRSTTNMNEFANKVLVYPNPVASGKRFQIRLIESVNQEIHVEVVNALGVIVSAEDLNDSFFEMTAPENPGLYMVRVIAKDKGIQYHKLIVK